jgi:hypothetical protein
VRSLFGDVRRLRTILGRESRRSINWTLKYFRAWIASHFSQLIHLLRSSGFWEATVLNRLHNSLGMKNFHVRWAPHQLTNELQTTRPAKCREILPMLEALQKNDFGKVVTGDESRFYLKTGHSAQWFVYRDNVATKTKPMIDTPKFILTVMRGATGFHVVDLMTSQDQLNS